jgi:hypothetical protein
MLISTIISEIIDTISITSANGILCNAGFHLKVQLKVGGGGGT